MKLAEQYKEINSLLPKGVRLRFALDNNIDGNGNTAIGASALNNTSGGQNVAIGWGSQSFNNTGGNNVSIGVEALGRNIAGTQNVAIGNNAGTYINLSAAL